MADWLRLVISLTVGLVLGWLMIFPLVRLLRHEREEARKAEQVATDRLLAAWRDGAVVPPRPSESVPPPDPLPVELQEEINQWEDPEHRQALEMEFRTRLGQGLGVAAILREQEDRHP
jgi:flagellar biosynthesis/type III secretory pathway M-ring protein FliF/YscJ